MNNLEKDQAELRSRRKTVHVLGVAIVIVPLYDLVSGVLEGPAMHMLVLTLLIATWLILYIDYCLLKLKVEIIEELSKGGETTKPNQDN